MLQTKFKNQHIEPKITKTKFNFTANQDVHGLCDFPSIFHETTSYCERRARSHQPFARTNAFLHSFVPSGAAAWNNHH